METQFLRSESHPEGRAKCWNNIPPTSAYTVCHLQHSHHLLITFSPVHISDSLCVFFGLFLHCFGSPDEYSKQGVPIWGIPNTRGEYVTEVQTCFWNQFQIKLQPSCTVQNKNIQDIFFPMGIAEQCKYNRLLGINIVRCYRREKLISSCMFACSGNIMRPAILPWGDKVPKPLAKLKELMKRNEDLLLELKVLKMAYPNRLTSQLWTVDNG